MAIKRNRKTVKRSAYKVIGALVEMNALPALKVPSTNVLTSNAPTEANTLSPNQTGTPT
jgi:hypothetical protein